MGNFALMVVMASVGSIVAALTIKPLTKLFRKFGFKTDEALTVPFYLLGALEAPLFLLMLCVPALPVVVALYGLAAVPLSWAGARVALRTESRHLGRVYGLGLLGVGLVTLALTV